MQPQDPCFQDFLSPLVSYRRWDYRDKPCPSLCQKALDGQLYSQGTDFTAWYIKGGGRPGSSYMKRFWEQDMPDDDCQAHQGGSVWILDKNGKDIGAVILERCVPDPLTIGDRELHGRYAKAKPHKTFQAQAVGRVAMWLDPALRGRGLMKLMLSANVIPVLEPHMKQAQSQGLFPFVRASDATANILQTQSDIPVPGFFRACLNEKEQLRTWMMTMNMDMHDHDRWGVEWRANAPATKRGPGAMR